VKALKHRNYLSTRHVPKTCLARFQRSLRCRREVGAADIGRGGEPRARSIPARLTTAHARLKSVELIGDRRYGALHKQRLQIDRENGASAPS